MSEDTTEVETDSAGAERTLLERLLPPVDPLGEDGVAKPARMSQREQLVSAGLGFANVAIAAGAASSMRSQQALALLAGIVASAVLIGGARVGNRIVAMLGLFACVVTRNAGTVVFLAFSLPYYAALTWMFLKFNRLTKAQAIVRRQQRSEARAAAPARGGRTSTKSVPGAAATKVRPTASNRYTPPKPPKRRPPPPSKPPPDRSIVD